MGTCYRRNPLAAIDALEPLSNEERGAYAMIVELIHARGGAVADDDSWLARCCRLDTRVWKRIRARLVELGRLYEWDGGLRSPQADDEVAAAQRRQRQAQAAGRASGLSRAAASNEIKDMTPTLVPDAPLIAQARPAARAEIAAHLARKDGYAMQDLTAALLQGMGYATVVSPPGPDGGTDVLAYGDALGAATPVLRVQVKHRADPAQREDIAALRGVLKSEREVGLFVSTGGFTREARREARDGAAHIRLIDLDDFLALWVRHHDALPAAAREGLRLAPVYFLDAPSGASSAALTCISSSTQAVTSFSEVST